MGILKQVNKLAEKITGTNPKKREIAKALDYIEQNYTAGGGGSSAESDVFVVTGTVENPRDPLTLDKNFDEILNAYESGKIVIFHSPFFTTFLSSLGYNEGGEYIQGDYFEANRSGKLAHTHVIINSNGYSDTIAQYTLTPASPGPGPGDLA